MRKDERAAEKRKEVMYTNNQVLSDLNLDGSVGGSGGGGFLLLSLFVYGIVSRSRLLVEGGVVWGAATNIIEINLCGWRCNF